MFKPHKFQTEIVGVPKILIDADVLRDMWHVTDIASTEVGWFCTVLKTGANELTIDGMYLPEQQCHGTTTEITASGEASLMQKIMQEESERGVAADDPNHRLNRLDAWFHSHVNMGVTPSQQDLDQSEVFRASGKPWFLRGIVNKAGLISIAYYEGRTSLSGSYIDDVPWAVKPSATPDPRREYWNSEVKDKVSALTYTTGYTPGAYGGDYKVTEKWNRDRFMGSPAANLRGDRSWGRGDFFGD